MPSSVRSRLVPLVLCVLTLVAGLAVHAADGLAFSGKLGDVLYALLVACGVWFLAPRAPLVIVGAVAGTWCLGVELLQLTGVPGAAAEAVPLSRLVLGSGFDAWDLPAYAAGVLVGVGVVALSRRPSRTAR